jgi:hypothetical protein
MRKEYDFSAGTRGKFYRPDAVLNIPVYLEPKIAKVFQKQAREHETTVSNLVNRVLRKEIQGQKRRAG